MQLEQRREVRNRSERRLAENADRAKPDRRAVPASGAASSRDMAGTSRHEDEAGVRRWPGGAHVGAAIQSA